MTASVRGSFGGARRDLLVYLASTWWDGPAGTDRQLALALRRYGPVLYVDPPISGLTRFLKPHLAAVAAAPRLREVEPGLIQLVTRVTPGMTRPVLRHLRAPLVHFSLRSAIDELTGRDDQSPVAAIISSRLDEAWPDLPARSRLLYATDDIVAGAELLGLPNRRLARLEAAALRGATVVATVSPALRDRYRGTGHEAQLIPNGCSAEAYLDVDELTPPDDVALPGPVAGLLGHVNDRIDLGLLEALAGAGISLLIVGPLSSGAHTQRFQALAERPNVCWVGGRPFGEMPRYLRVIDVGLTPYVDNAFNRASFPLKTLEYLAAGRAVVATDLPAHRWLDTDLIALANGPAAFVEQVRQALTIPRTRELSAARQEFARRHSWRERAATMADLLGLDEPSQPPHRPTARS